MTRQNLIFVTLAGVALAAAPIMPAYAQSGPALVHAERTCLDHGVTPHSAAFNACVARAARAFDRGEPGVAHREARTAGDARNVCMSYGLDPRSLGYRQCIASQMERPAVQPYVVRYEPPYVDEVVGPRTTVIIDEYGRRYDRYGNRLDVDGYVIRNPYLP